MKRFNQLTPVQQQAAVEFAKSIFLDKDIGVEFGKPISPALIQDYAESAAEMAFYSESGDLVIPELDLA